MRQQHLQKQKQEQEQQEEQQRETWQRELLKLEKQNKKRLLEARMEQDQMARQQQMAQQQSMRHGLQMQHSKLDDYKNSRPYLPSVPGFSHTDIYVSVLYSSLTLFAC
jgi:hypothetical protein